eukprot:9347268-Pyramimonas_sp.AAC.1
MGTTDNISKAAPEMRKKLVWPSSIHLVSELEHCSHYTLTNPSLRTSDRPCKKKGLRQLAQAHLARDGDGDNNDDVNGGHGIMGEDDETDNDGDT